jgi:hypothetical protein
LHLLIIIVICLFYYDSYPPRYIHTHLHKLFSSYLPTPLVLPIITNQSDFVFIRQILLRKPTITGYQLASRIANSIDADSRENVDTLSLKTRLQKQTKFATNLIIHYTYEKRLQSNKKDIHQLWNQLFQQTPVTDTRLIVDNRNNRNMTRELVHRRPQVSLKTTIH